MLKDITRNAFTTDSEIVAVIFAGNTQKEKRKILMSEKENLRVIENNYAAFGRGDLPAILDSLVATVEWRHPRPTSIPWGGLWRGKAGGLNVSPKFSSTLTLRSSSQWSFWRRATK
jgi:hypothetical protein